MKLASCWLYAAKILAMRGHTNVKYTLAYLALTHANSLQGTVEDYDLNPTRQAPNML